MMRILALRSFHVSEISPIYTNWNMASPAHMKIDNKQLFEAMALPTQLKIDEQQLFEAIVLPMSLFRQVLFWK